MEFGGHKRLNQRQTQPARLCKIEVGRRSHAIVGHGHHEVLVGVLKCDGHHTAPVGKDVFGKGVIYNVLQQLGEHHSQWHRTDERQSTRGPLQLETDWIVRILQTLLDKSDQRACNILERRIIARSIFRKIVGECLVDDRDGSDATNRFGERELPLFRLDPSRLQTQQGRDGLKVVLDPVVDLSNRCVFRDEQTIASLQFRDVAQQDKPTVDLIVGQHG